MYKLVFTDQNGERIAESLIIDDRPDNHRYKLHRHRRYNRSHFYKQSFGGHTPAVQDRIDAREFARKPVPNHHPNWPPINFEWTFPLADWYNPAFARGL